MFTSIIGLGQLKRVSLLFAALPSLVCAQAGFTSGADMNYARSFHTSTLLADGTVLIAGGYINNTPLYTAETYDPNTGAFTPTGPMVEDYPRNATLLADGSVLLVGAIAQLYDPSTRTFAATGNGATAYGCAATLLNNGKVLLTDDPSPYGPSATAELHDSETGSFAPTGPYASLEIAQMDYAPNTKGWDCRRATLLANGTVLVAGGVAAEIYDPQTNTFTLTGTQITTGSGYVTTLPLWGDPADATPLLNSMVLFTGGDPDYLGPSQEAWSYDPSTGTFRMNQPMISSRTGNPTVLLPDGTVLIAGGRYYGAIDSAEFYNPTSATFAGAGHMTVPRCFHTATLLANGQVLIAGGLNDSGSLASTEIYTPAVVIPAPTLFSLSGDGSDAGAIWHAITGLAVSQGSPATAGEILSMYTTNLSDSGVIPPRVTVGGRLAEVIYFGGAPGYPGYYQVNFRVPDGIAAGPSVSVRLTYLGRSSNRVAISVQ